MKKVAIAIDGPAGAGKSTIARIVADRLGLLYIDTGAMYRAVTLYMLENNISINDIDEIIDMMKAMDIILKGSSIFVNCRDVTHEIRSQKVNRMVSPVSAIPEVRERLVEIQREIARENSVVMDGRDIGSNVLKDAGIKIYLTASVEERARRRCREMVEKGLDVDLEGVIKDISARDKIDSERKLNPLKKADDAILVDTTGKSIDEVVETIISIIKGA